MPAGSDTRDMAVRELGHQHLGLPEDHPGFSDQEYRARRAAIARSCASYEPGDAIPDVEYTAEEDEVWRLVATELAAKHERYACRAYREAAGRLVLPTERLPQLAEVDERLRALSGFRLRPVAGLVPTRQFYGALAERVFHSTQYIRHHSAPFYTPEPDIVHEIIGHANMLASTEFASLYHAAGEASLRTASNPREVFLWTGPGGAQTAAVPRSVPWISGLSAELPRNRARRYRNRG